MVVTYNGDFFDWPYVDSRCKKYKMNLYYTLGIRGTGELGTSIFCPVLSIDDGCLVICCGDIIAIIAVPCVLVLPIILCF